MGNYTIFQMFENPREGRQARNFTANFQISNRLPNRYSPKIDVGCPWNMTALVIQTQGTLAHLRSRAFLKIPFLNKNFTYLATLHNEFQGRLKSCLYSFAHSKSLNLKRCYMKKGRGANVRCKSIAAKLTTAS